MAKSTLDGKKVLVVDDEPDVLAILKEEIQEAGYGSREETLPRPRLTI